LQGIDENSMNFVFLPLRMKKMEC